MEKTGLDLTTDMSLDMDSGYAVIMFNDDVTPFEYVVGVLVTIFDYQPEDAIAKMLEIHNGYSAVVGQYSFEEANKRVEEVDTVNEQTGFLLQTNVQRM